MPKPSPTADSGRTPGPAYPNGPAFGASGHGDSARPPFAAAGPRHSAEPADGSGGGRKPSAADYYAVNRGGGLFSEAVSQRLGARIAVGAHKRGLAPTVLTVANLGLGCLVSFAVIATAGAVADGRFWAWPLGLLALAGWQLAYAFDCADGQLARVTGQSSTAGGRLDVLCDVAVQISLVSALAAVAEAQVPDTPAWLLAAFAGTWMVNLVTSVMQTGERASSMVTSRSLPVRLVKLVRDYGAVIALAGVVLTIAPQWMIWFVGLFTLVNAAFLAASAMFSARAALRGEP
jgi:phosphatidylglycerophosphate synthase